MVQDTAMEDWYEAVYDQSNGDILSDLVPNPQTQSSQAHHYSNIFLNRFKIDIFTMEYKNVHTRPTHRCNFAWSWAT